MKRILRALAFTGLLGIAAAGAAQAQVYVGGRVAVAVPPCPGVGYTWAPGYYAGAVWYPGRWVYRGYDRDDYRYRVYDRDDYRYYHRDYDRDRDRHYDRDGYRDRGYRGHDRGYDHDRR